MEHKLTKDVERSEPVKSYIEQALQTNSDEFFGDLVPLRIMNARMAEAIKAADQLDKIKKSLFYGRENAFAHKLEGEVTMAAVEDEKTRQILHGVLGVFTEAGELLEALNKKSSTDIDAINIKEEIGDIFWYCAILAHYLEFSFEEVMETNIAKLRQRFPNKFTTYDANNRDLGKEREILEAAKDNGYEPA